MNGRGENIECLRSEIVRLQNENHALHQENLRYRMNEMKLVEVQRIAGVVSWEVNCTSGVLDMFELSRWTGSPPPETAILSGVYGSLDDLIALIHPDDRKAFETAYDESLRGDEPQKLAHRIVLSDGEIRHVEHFFQTFPSQSGLPLKTVGLIHDVTASMRAAAKIEEARRRAQEAASARSTFVANMSHEIRTPLNGVIGFTDLLLDTALTEDQRSTLQMIARSSRVLLTLLNDILDFSRIDSGQLTLEAIDFDLQDVLNDVQALFRARASAKNLEFSVDRAPGTPNSVVGDPLRLQQILNNLVANAVKFTESGRVHLVASHGTNDHGHPFHRLVVQDTGIGIPKNRLNTIFSAFVQADDSTTRKYGGSGLGLAICKQLATAMGGRIGIESEVDAGTTVWVEIPFPLSRSPARPVGEKGRPAVRTAGPHGSGEPPAIRPGCRVLVVEDHPVNQLLARRLLTAEGLTVDIAINGQEAVERVYTTAYDLVLMDVQMPIMDGNEATSAIRRDPKFRGLPIVAMTANAMREERQLSLEAGMNGYLTKPIERSALRDVLRQWLAVRRPVEGTGTPAPALPTTHAQDSERVLAPEQCSQNHPHQASDLPGYANPPLFQPTPLKNA